MPLKRIIEENSLRRPLVKRLVIDATVAMSAGTTEAPQSRNCRAVLDAVRDIGHQVVMSDGIREEWKRHASRYSRTWQVSMEARKRILRLEVEENANLRENIRRYASSNIGRDAMLKDCHLIEAAAATDRTVISSDAKARAWFAMIAGRISLCRRIVWVDPNRAEENPIEWIKGGAQDEQHRCLKP
jgi:hypothetical protein